MILKFLAVLLILVAMIVILLSIDHLFSGNFRSGERDTAAFRKEVRERDEVMSKHNLFRQFISNGNRK